MSTTIWERINTALTGLSLPMAASVYISATPESLPDEYLVYFLISDPPEQHADNVEKAKSYHVQISYYNRAGLAAAPDITGAMIAAGFTRAPSREIPYNELTRHFGLAFEFWYYEEE